MGFTAVAGIEDPWWLFLLISTAYAILASPMSIPLMFGEEFGWRAYLLPKLMPLGGRRAVLLTGVIHGAWHWPFVFMGYEYGFGYFGAPVAGPLVFVVFVVFLSAFFAWVTLRTGSVWPAAFGHGAINASAMLMFFFLSGATDRLIGPLPVGIIGSLGYAAMALVIFFSPRALAPMAGPEPAEPKPIRAAATMA
jgi:membrane protease YdiL (CAAX protease family)